MKTSKKMYFSLIILLVWIASCAVNPVTGKRELMLLTEQDEIALGRQTDQQVVQMYGLYDDPTVLKYINEMGQEMVKISHRPHLKFEFKIMDSPVINAFAVPGGYVYITRGILAYLNNEAELAGVVGHEIGHVTARHSAKQYSKAQLAQIGLGVGTILSEDFARYAGLASQGIGLLFLKFSRDSERQSDQLGVEYSTKVGYNAREMANFFATLNQMQVQSESGGLPSFLSTHPNPADRVVAVQQLAKDWQAKLQTKELQIKRNNYLNKINGLIVDENPRQGFVENNVFYHPDLKFKFPVPAEWKITNLPSQVQMASADQKAAIVFTLSSEKSTTAAASQFINQTKAQVINQDNQRVHGFRATRVISSLAGQSGNIQIMSYFIEKPTNIYVFHGFCVQEVYQNYQAIFRKTMVGFDVLRDRAKLDIKPNRLRIRKTTRQMTLRQALKNFGVADDQLEKMVLLNAMKLNQTVPANTLIKTIDK